MVAIKRAIEPYVRKKAKERQQEAGKQFGRGKDNEKIDPAKLAEPNETRDIVAGFVGVGRTILKKAEDIVNAAEQEPEK